MRAEKNGGYACNKPNELEEICAAIKDAKDGFKILVGKYGCM